MERELECGSEGECVCVCVSPCPAIDSQPRSSWLELRVVAHLGKDAAQCCVTVSHFIVMVAHHRGTTAHPHLQYRPTRRPGSPPRPVSHSRLLAACPGARCRRHTAQDITSHHRVGAPVRPCTTNSIPRCERVSTSRALGTTSRARPVGCLQ